MSLPKESETADYIQLDICGKTAVEAVERYRKYKSVKPIILHGDWTKKGSSENDILKDERVQEYLQIIEQLTEETNIMGFTVHPPFRSKTDIPMFLRLIEKIEKESGIPFFIENRSSSRILLSNEKEITEMSNRHLMTIDIPQLYISCGYNQEKTLQALDGLNWENIAEIHLANIKRDGTRSYVARRLNDGVLEIEKFIPYIQKVDHITLEILGGNRIFEEQKEYLLSLLK